MAKGSRPSPPRPPPSPPTSRPDPKRGAPSLRSIWPAQAIRAAHLEAGDADPSASEGVRRVLRGLSRQRAGQGGRRQAAALTAEALAAIRATAAAPRAGPTTRTESPEAARIRGAVDVALASVMRDAMLRRSEAAALEWADVELRPDGSGRLRVRRSKTDQEGEGAVQYLGKGTAAAVREIRPGNPDPDARVFGLRSGRSVARRLAAMARAAGLEGAFSGHSPRVGMAQDLVASGASVAAVQIAGRRVRPDARPLRPGRAGRTRGRRPVLRGVRGLPPGPSDPRPQGRRIAPDGLRAGGRPRRTSGGDRGRHPCWPVDPDTRHRWRSCPDRSDRLHVHR